MTKRQQLFYLVLNLLSAILLIGESTNGIKAVVLVVLSLFMMPRPITLLPVLFVSSWSINFVAMPGLAAFFYYLVLLVVSVLIRGKSVITFTKPPFFVIFAALFAVWIFITGFYSVSGSWYSPMKLSLFIVPLLLFSRFHLHNMEYLRKSLIVMAAFFSVYFLLVSLFFPVEFVPDKETTDFVSETSHSFRSDMNPNTASQIVLLVFIILFCGAFSTKKHWLSIFALLNFGSLMYLGSRTGFFAACIITVVYLFLVLKTSFFKKAILLVAIVVVFFAIFSRSNRFERAERLTVYSVQEDNGSGRFVTWRWLFVDVIPNNLIKGIGIGRDNYEYLGFKHDADNMYVDVLCQTGVVGLALFLTFYVFTLILLWKKRGMNRDWDFLIAIFLAYMAEGWGESVFDTPMFWFCGLIAVLAINEKEFIQRKKTIASP